MTYEFKRRFCPPLANREVAVSFNVRDMTSIPRDTKEDVLVALVDRNDAWAEEGVVKSRDEEERLLDQVEFVTDVTG